MRPNSVSVPVTVEVVYYMITEALIHLHYKLKGAWIRPTPCEFCGVKHQEIFDYELCGGEKGMIRVVEYYLWRLNWPITR